MGLTVDGRTVPTSTSRDTKNYAEYQKSDLNNLDIVPWFKNPWSVASYHCK